jgi:hypothetical protein
MLRYLSEQMQVEFRDKNPIQRLRSSETHLLEMSFFRHAFEYREVRFFRELSFL